MVTAKRNWERTLDFLAKIRQVAKQVAHAAEHLRIPTERLKPLFKAAWKLKGQLPRLAGLAKETGRDPERYFWWLYGRALRGAPLTAQGDANNVHWSVRDLNI
jgi:hypothetical protein